MDLKTTIRAATPHDATKLAALLPDLFPKLRDQPRTSLRQQLRDHLTAAQASSHTIFVADAGTEIVGDAAVHWLPCLFQSGFDGYLSELFVATSARGQAVGSSLLEATKAEAERRGCPRLTLINLRNRESYERRFYAKHGWVEQPEAARFVFSLPG